MRRTNFARVRVSASPVTSVLGNSYAYTAAKLAPNLPLIVDYLFAEVQWMHYVQSFGNGGCVQVLNLQPTVATTNMLIALTTTLLKLLHSVM